jgi:carbonic anhydrase
VHLLAVNRIMIVPHTRCRMAGGSEDGVHAAIRAAGGPDTRSIAFVTTADADAQQEALRGDVQRVRSSPYVSDVTVGGFLYDVDDGRLRRVC